MIEMVRDVRLCRSLADNASSRTAGRGGWCRVWCALCPFSAAAGGHSGLDGGCGNGDGRLGTEGRWGRQVKEDEVKEGNWRGGAGDWRLEGRGKGRDGRWRRGDLEKWLSECAFVEGGVDQNWVTAQWIPLLVLPACWLLDLGSRDGASQADLM